MDHPSHGLNIMGYFIFLIGMLVFINATFFEKNRAAQVFGSWTVGSSILLLFISLMWFFYDNQHETDEDE